MLFENLPDVTRFLQRKSLEHRSLSFRTTAQHNVERLKTSLTIARPIHRRQNLKSLKRKWCLVETSRNGDGQSHTLHPSNELRVSNQVLTAGSCAWDWAAQVWRFHDATLLHMNRTGESKSTLQVRHAFQFVKRTAKAPDRLNLRVPFDLHTTDPLCNVQREAPRHCSAWRFRNVSRASTFDYEKQTLAYAMQFCLEPVLVKRPASQSVTRSSRLKV